ncbi:hypothetical protein ACFLZM_00015 [Thermodesulfobacteriota bacterium]
MHNINLLNAMTYNFDPDRWYDIEIAALKAEYDSGKKSQTEYEQALDDLDRRYNAMWERLDGSYRIPQDKSAKIPKI